LANDSPFRGSNPVNIDREGEAIVVWRNGRGGRRGLRHRKRFLTMGFCQGKKFHIVAGERVTYNCGQRKGNRELFGERG